MPSLPFVTLDVFTQDHYAGNPLALVRLPHDRDVSTEQMQTIAREFNLSETIFVHEKQTGQDGVDEWRVRIFLTQAEVPFAGHPTIGCAVYALGTLVENAQRGRLLANAGPIELKFGSGVATASIPHNFHRHTQYPSTIDDVLKLQPQLEAAFDKRPTLKNTESVNVVSPVRGMNFLIVELSTIQFLRSVNSSSKPAPKLDDEWNVGFSASYFYVCTSTSFEDGKDDLYRFQTRMIEGTFEDPATGAAACGLCCFYALNRRHRTNTRATRFEITQGVEMGRKSDIDVIVTLNESQDAVEKVELSGSAVKVMEGIVEY